MAVDIVNRQSGGDEQLVRVGNDQVVSMQLLQNVYNELTGKTESLARAFRLHHKTTFEDICQLNAKIVQLYEQYNIVAQNCTITLYHTDDAKEQFSSFDRFKLYDGSSLSPVENIRLKYNFLIVLPKTDRPQSYDIEIDIHSRAAIHQRSKKEVGPQRRFFITLASQTGSVEIEYVDYTVARNFMVAIEHWFASLPQSNAFPFLSLVKRIAPHFTFLFRYVSATVIAAYFFVYQFKWVPETASALSSLFAAGVLCFSTIFVASGVSAKLGSILTDAVDRAQPLSYLKLNRGDELAISALESSNVRNAILGVGSLVIAVVTNLFATWLAKFLGIGT